MNEDVSPKQYTEFILPASLVTKVDISRLLGEVERVDNEFVEAAAREKVGSDQSVQPVLSAPLAEFLEKNHIDITNTHTRGELIRELHQLKDAVPTVHMTFSVTADGESLEQIVAWLRGSVHPQAVLEVGLQPSLVAGVYLRTTNRVHDLSLRTALTEHRDLLAKELEAIRVGQ